jgi:hypothetical protein
MNVCNAHGLYDAIIYVFNNGMLDYVTPVEELMSALSEAIKSQTQVRKGQKMQRRQNLKRCCLGTWVAFNFGLMVGGPSQRPN